MLTCINDVGGWETGGGRTGEDGGMCGCVESALSDTCENRPESKTQTCLKIWNMQTNRCRNSWKSVVLVLPELLSESVGRNVHKTSLAQFMLRHKCTERYQETD